MALRPAPFPGRYRAGVHGGPRDVDPVRCLRALRAGERPGAADRDVAPRGGGLGNRGAVRVARRGAHLPRTVAGAEGAVAADSFRALHAVFVVRAECTLGANVPDAANRSSSGDGPILRSPAARGRGRRAHGASHADRGPLRRTPGPDLGDDPAVRGRPGAAVPGPGGAP